MIERASVYPRDHVTNHLGWCYFSQTDAGQRKELRPADKFGRARRAELAPKRPCSTLISLGARYVGRG